MQFEIVTEGSVRIGPFSDKQKAVDVAEDFGLGPMAFDDEPGWLIGTVAQPA